MKKSSNGELTGSLLIITGTMGAGKSAILDRAHLEDFAIVNENTSLTDVALEVLGRAGWISE